MIRGRFRRLQSRPQIRMPEIVALPKHRLPLLPRQRVAKTVPEVQPRTVPAAFAEVPVSLPRNLCLRFGDRHDLDLESLDELIDFLAHNRAPPAVDDDG